MTRYVYETARTARTARRTARRTASKKKRGRKGRKVGKVGGNKTRKQCGGNKTSFLGGLLKPLVLPALFFGAQKVQQKRVHRRKSRRGKKTRRNKK
jgi:hypothetical protein